MKTRHTATAIASCLLTIATASQLSAAPPAGQTGSAPLTGQAEASASQDLRPFAYVTVRGGSGGEPVARLHRKDQSGTADDPARYVTFTTPSTTYSGYRQYTLPAAVSRTSVTALQLKENYKGPAKSSQRWSFYAYDWTARRWIGLGDNASAGAGTWSPFVFSAADPRRFIRAGTGEIRILLQSGNAGGDAKLDYESVKVTYTVSGGPSIGGCPVFPVDNIWNTRVDSLPVHGRSSRWIDSIGRTTGIHMDFGSGTWAGGPIGIPYNIVAGSTVRKYTVDFYYPDESDRGPYPIPPSPKREWGSDHHILVVDTESCKLYEVYDAWYDAGWHGGSGAIWSLRSHALRPDGWTSADAAGLPIVPGLVRYEEVAAGRIDHALRFTADYTNSYVWPARHLTSGTPGVMTSTPPMGARFRLKAAFDISGYPARMQVILKAMKLYGIILADNGSDWYVTGAPDSRWDNHMLHLLDDVTGNDFEAVDASGLMLNPNSGQVRR